MHSQLGMRCCRVQFPHSIKLTFSPPPLPLQVNTVVTAIVGGRHLPVAAAELSTSQSEKAPTQVFFSSVATDFPTPPL